MSDEEALAVVRAARPLMQLSVENDGRPVTWRPEVPARGRENRFWVFNREGRPCRRCDTIVLAARPGRRQPPTFWCPECQT